MCLPVPHVLWQSKLLSEGGYSKDEDVRSGVSAAEYLQAHELLLKYLMLKEIDIFLTWKVSVASDNHPPFLRTRSPSQSHTFLAWQAACLLLVKWISGATHCGIPMVAFVAADRRLRRLPHFAEINHTLATSHRQKPLLTTRERNLTPALQEADASYVSATHQMELHPSKAKHERT
jgi:hypothetical protein